MAKTPEFYEYKTGTNRLGLWLFLVSDAFVFAGLMVTRMNLLGLTRPAPQSVSGIACHCSPAALLILYEPRRDR